MTECAVELENVNEIELVNNYNYNTLGSETFVGINTAGTTDTKTIVLKDNYNLRYKEYDGEVPQIDVFKLDKDVIKIDGDISDWNDVGTAIEMNGSSLATGDEINPADYADVFGWKSHALHGRTKDFISALRCVIISLIMLPCSISGTETVWKFS